MTIIEVDTEKGFWHGGLYWSIDQDGNNVRLNKKEYDQMIINKDVLILE